MGFWDKAKSWGSKAVSVGGAVLRGAEGAVVETVAFVAGLPGDVEHFARRLGGASKAEADRKSFMPTSHKLEEGYYNIRKKVTGSGRPHYEPGSAESYAESIGYWGVNLASMAGAGRAILIKGARKLAPLAMPKIEQAAAGIRGLAGSSLTATFSRSATAVLNSPAAAEVAKVYGVATLGSVGASIVTPFGEALLDSMADEPSAKPSPAVKQNPAQSVPVAPALASTPVEKATPVIKHSSVSHSSAMPKVGSAKTLLSETDRHAVNQNVVDQILSPGFLMDPQTGAFDNKKIDALQNQMVQAGKLSATHYTGTINGHTMRAIHATFQEELDPANITSDQRQTLAKNAQTLFESLHEAPPEARSFDVRVLSFQANAQLLGLYKGNLDGLSGPKTIAAAQGVMEMSKAAPAQMAAAVQPEVTASAQPAAILGPAAP